MPLCTNRFVVASNGLATSCSFDVTIVPVPSILLLVALTLFLTWRTRSQPFPTRRGFPSSLDISPLPNYLHYAYVALVVALLGMRILEITRLAAARMGIGLLPFGIVANLAILGLIGIRGGNRGLVASLILIVYWALLLGVTAAKVDLLQMINKMHPAKGTAYPSSDWLLDNGVMVGLYALFLVYECIYYGTAASRKEFRAKQVQTDETPITKL